MIEPGCLDETDLADDLQPQVQRVSRCEPFMKVELGPRIFPVMSRHGAIVLATRW